MSRRMAAIDIHKKVQMVVVATVSETVAEGEATQRIGFEGRRFGGGTSERAHLVAWLRERQVEEVVMESTAQYWKPVWLDLEPHFAKLHLAQAHSNKAPKGRKNDFADAKRLARRLAAGELILSFVPDAEQRTWRTIDSQQAATGARPRAFAESAGSPAGGSPDQVIQRGHRSAGEQRAAHPRSAGGR
jgi:hypothetical protein